MSQEVHERSAFDVDVVVIGAGVTGIYQAYRAREEGFSVQVLEAGHGVGGTWFWNRYPEARFDSESYTYGYLFSKELWEEWEWSERFAGQPEIERYFNYVVDKFDLRKDIRFDSKVVSSSFDESTGGWTTTTEDDFVVTSRYLVAATGVLSVPFYPNVEGRESFQGESYHTGLWPSAPVDFTGKRVAVIGTGSSGVQLIPVVAREAASLTVYQRTANWCTPLNNAPISAEEQAELKANYESIKATLDTSVSGFLHKMDFRKFEEDADVDRLPFYEKMWSSPGFEKLTTHYIDMTLNPVANKEWSDFVADKIRSLVDDPETAEKLIPKDHGYGGKRPPFVTDYFQVYNQPNVELVSLKETPMQRVTPVGIETESGVKEFDIIVWSTGYDFGTGALNRLGVSGRDGLELKSYWGDGPRTYLGTVAAGFPNFFFPGGPHGSTGNNPRYSGDQVEFVTDALKFARDNDIAVMEISAAAEEEWTAMMDSASVYSSFTDKSYFYGANIPGKPVKQLLNPAGRPTLQQIIAKTIQGGFEEFRLVRGRTDDRASV
ncbi:NAD(P)/FAD-dependent oxidoreductase [Rhodococcoides fascians A25f]|uniref:flavin-containing monooxygenase n=1 Tax=Rhodococcoides fascians TaxID=1828 RepID=UPI000690CC17|nr:NAD(P)/FAD-dependent oxidoreductase [Rhodococcus fascians]QII07364.1 NAD(P)/FAD-dependent oxidoreductase [Rhodococcus fascians A25f]